MDKGECTDCSTITKNRNVSNCGWHYQCEECYDIQRRRGIIDNSFLRYECND